MLYLFKASICCEVVNGNINWLIIFQFLHVFNQEFCVERIRMIKINFFNSLPLKLRNVFVVTIMFEYDTLSSPIFFSNFFSQPLFSQSLFHRLCQLQVASLIFFYLRCLIKAKPSINKIMNAIVSQSKYLSIKVFTLGPNK